MCNKMTIDELKHEIDSIVIGMWNQDMTVTNSICTGAEVIKAMLDKIQKLEETIENLQNKKGCRNEK